MNKLDSQRGKSPDMAGHPKVVLSGKGCGISKINQDVGSSSHSLKRVRNSSLVEKILRRKCPGLKHHTEAAELVKLVEEHS